jgi:N-acetylmuramoyl-L-alanine amidase
MSIYHTVVQGEYLSKIAKDHGLADYLTIWNHPQNADLKKKRQNPNVLLPGDKLFIPTRELKEEPRSTEEKHRFEVKHKRLMLRLTLEDAFFKPIANAKCELTVEGQTLKLTTDGKGRLEHEIPSDAENASLVIKDSRTPINDQFLPIQIGHLDPVEEISGQKARLNNLGYFAGPLDKEDEELFRSAVEEFQCEHMGPSAVDGKCGTKTQAKLKEVHGC